MKRLTEEEREIVIADLRYVGYFPEEAEISKESIKHERSVNAIFDDCCECEIADYRAERLDKIDTAFHDVGYEPDPNIDVGYEMYIKLFRRFPV